MEEKVLNLKDPSPEESNKTIKRFLGEDRVIAVFGKCVIDYEGRASSYLGLGDRLVILKPDGTLLVHSKSNRKPVNWQPPGSKHTSRLNEGNLVIESRRRNPKEKLEIVFNDVFSVSSLELIDEEELQLNRSEEEMGDLILEKPWIIENGFKVIEREKETDLGYIDIFGRDEEGNKVIIELKRKKIGLSSVSQLKRYHDSLKETYSGLRGIIVGPSVSRKAKNFLEKEGLEFVKLKPDACELGTDLTEYTSSQK